MANETRNVEIRVKLDERGATASLKQHLQNLRDIRDEYKRLNDEMARGPGGSGRVSRSYARDNPGAVSGADVQAITKEIREAADRIVAALSRGVTVSGAAVGGIVAGAAGAGVFTPGPRAAPAGAAVAGGSNIPPVAAHLPSATTPAPTPTPPAPFPLTMFGPHAGAHAMAREVVLPRALPYGGWRPGEKFEPSLLPFAEPLPPDASGPPKQYRNLEYLHREAQRRRAEGMLHGAAPDLPGLPGVNPIIQPLGFIPQQVSSWRPSTPQARSWPRMQVSSSETGSLRDLEARKWRARHFPTEFAGMGLTEPRVNTQVIGWSPMDAAVEAEMRAQVRAQSGLSTHLRDPNDPLTGFSIFGHATPGASAARKLGTIRAHSLEESLPAGAVPQEGSGSVDELVSIQQEHRRREREQWLQRGSSTAHIRNIRLLTRQARAEARSQLGGHFTSGAVTDPYAALGAQAVHAEEKEARRQLLRVAETTKYRELKESMSHKEAAKEARKYARDLVKQYRQMSREGFSTSPEYIQEHAAIGREAILLEYSRGEEKYYRDLREEYEGPFADLDQGEAFVKPYRGAGTVESAARQTRTRVRGKLRYMRNRRAAQWLSGLAERPEFTYETAKQTRAEAESWLRSRVHPSLAARIEEEHGHLGNIVNDLSPPPTVTSPRATTAAVDYGRSAMRELLAQRRAAKATTPTTTTSGEDEALGQILRFYGVAGGAGETPQATAAHEVKAPKLEGVVEAVRSRAGGGRPGGLPPGSMGVMGEDPGDFGGILNLVGGQTHAQLRQVAEILVNAVGDFLRRVAGGARQAAGELLRKPPTAELVPQQAGKDWLMGHLTAARDAGRKQWVEQFRTEWEATYSQHLQDTNAFEDEELQETHDRWRGQQYRRDRATQPAFNANPLALLEREDARRNKPRPPGMFGALGQGLSQNAAGIGRGALRGLAFGAATGRPLSGAVGGMAPALGNALGQAVALNPAAAVPVAVASLAAAAVSALGKAVTWGTGEALKTNPHLMSMAKNADYVLGMRRGEGFSGYQFQYAMGRAERGSIVRRAYAEAQGPLEGAGSISRGIQQGLGDVEAHLVRAGSIAARAIGLDGADQSREDVSRDWTRWLILGGWANRAEDSLSSRERMENIMRLMPEGQGGVTSAIGFREQIQAGAMTTPSVMMRLEDDTRHLIEQFNRLGEEVRRATEAQRQEREQRERNMNAGGGDGPRFGGPGGNVVMDAISNALWRWTPWGS